MAFSRYSQMSQRPRTSITRESNPLTGISDQPDHPPVPSAQTGIYSSLVTDQDLALMKKKFVKVSGSGELEVQPDQVDFCIRITSSRIDLVESRESVKKREDYIMAVLKRAHISETNITPSSTITRRNVAEDEEDEENVQFAFPLVDSGQEQNNNGTTSTKRLQQNQLVLTREILVNSDSLLKYLNIFSICTEKLDKHVVISQPIIRFTPALIQKQTQLCLRQAMQNAQSKAEELIKSNINPTVRLGRLFYTVEDFFKIEELKEYYDGENEGASSSFHVFKWKKYNKRLTCQITSVYELNCNPRKFI